MKNYGLLCESDNTLYIINDCKENGYCKELYCTGVMEKQQSKFVEKNTFTKKVFRMHNDNLADFCKQEHLLVLEPNNSQVIFAKALCDAK